MCRATLWGLPDALRCQETGEHLTHRYVSTSVDDGKHNDDADLEVWE